MGFVSELNWTFLPSTNVIYILFYNISTGDSASRESLQYRVQLLLLVLLRQLQLQLEVELKVSMMMDVEVSVEYYSVQLVLPMITVQT